MQLVTSTLPQVRRDRLLRVGAVEVATGLPKSTIYLLMRQKEFPLNIKLSARCVAWPESQVLQWIQDRIAADKTLETQGS